MDLKLPIYLISLTLLNAGTVTYGIVDGQVAEVGAWPWMASVRVDKMTRCGGVLIGPQTVLTSADCVSKSSNDISVVLGMHNQKDANQGKPEVIEIKERVIHEKFEPEPNFWKYNIAILKLSRPASNNTFIKPIKLPPKNFDATGEWCTVTGWGREVVFPFEGKEVVDELRQKDLQVWPIELCSRWWQDSDQTVKCSNVPVDDFAGVCSVDRGGPLSCPTKDGYILSGILIWRPSSCKGKGPALTTDIISYLDWIEKNR